MMKMNRITFLPLALLLSIGIFSTTACSKQDLPPMENSKVTGLIMTDTKIGTGAQATQGHDVACLLYTSPSPRDRTRSRMPSSA